MANWKLLALTVIGGGALILGSLSTAACTAEAEAGGGSAGSESGGSAGSAGSAAGAGGSAAGAGGSAAGAGGSAAGAAGAAGGAGAATSAIVEAFKANAACYTCIQAMTGMTADGMQDCSKALSGCEGGKCDESAKCITDYATAHTMAKADSLVSCEVNDCIDNGPVAQEPPAAAFLTCLSEKCTTECKTTKGFEPKPAAADCTGM